MTWSTVLLQYGTGTVRVRVADAARRANTYGTVLLAQSACMPNKDGSEHAKDGKQHQATATDLIYYYIIPEYFPYFSLASSFRSHALGGRSARSTATAVPVSACLVGDHGHNGREAAQCGYHG